MIKKLKKKTKKHDRKQLISFLILFFFIHFRFFSHKDLIQVGENISLDCSKIQDEEKSFFVNIRHPLTGGDFLMSIHDPQHEVVSMNIFKNSCYECEILNPLLSVLNQFELASLIDMGGNIGMYSLHAAALSRNVIAFEPLKWNLQKFCGSINKNIDFEKFVTLIPKALTKETNVTFVQFDTSGFKKAVYSRKKNQTNFGSMQTRDGQKNEPFGELGKDYALATTLDSVLEHTSLPSKDVILKIDIEGSECRALAGGVSSLNKLNIKYAAIEMTPERLKACDDWNKIVHLFFKNGLKPFKYEKTKQKWEAIDIEKRNWNHGMYDLAFAESIPDTNQN